jgi:outer membrane protein assembly factor BamB
MRWLGAVTIIALLALSSGIPSAISQVDGVPQEPDAEFRLGAGHVGQVEGDVPLANTTLWVKEVESPVKSSPVVSAGRVFVGTMDGEVLCLSDSTGSLLWSFPTGGAVESSPAVLGERVYVGSDDSRVYCLDTLSGEEIWNFSTGGEIKSSISILGGRLYVGSNDFRVYCLNVGNGREIWNFSTDGWVFSTPAVADGRVYFGSCDGLVYCVDAITGHELWNFTAAYAPASPAITDGVVVIGTYDNHMYFIDAVTGDELGNFSEARNEIYSSAAVVEAVGRELPDAYFGDNAGTFIALKDGVLDWTLDFTLLITSSPVLAVTEDDRRFLVYGVEDGLLVCVEDENHASAGTSEPVERWRLQLGTSISTSPFPYHNRIYVGAENGSTGLIACIGKLGNPGDTGRIVIESPAEGAFVSGHVDMAFRVEGFEPLSAEVTVDGTVIPASQVAERWRANIQLSGSTRELLITARARVENGVIIEEGVTVTFLEEGAQGPVVSILKPEQDVRVKGVVVARGTAEAERPILWVWARWDDEGEWRNATGTEDWVVALDTANLSDGSHRLNVEVFDGLLGEDSVKVLVGDEDEDGRDITWLEVAIVAVLVVVVAILMATKPRKKGEIIPEDNTG